MQLKYRGSTYNYNPPQVEMEPSGVQGKYRGLEWRFRNPKKNPVQQTSLNLMYRGVAYQTGSNSAQSAVQEHHVVQTETPSTDGQSVASRARALLMGHHNDVKRRQQTMLARSIAEIGLETSASEYWAPIQGKVASQNWASYDRSRAAFS